MSRSLPFLKSSAVPERSLSPEKKAGRERGGGQGERGLRGCRELPPLSAKRFAGGRGLQRLLLKAGEKPVAQIWLEAGAW